MRKMDKMIPNMPREVLLKLFSRDNSKTIEVIHNINGKKTIFRVAYQCEAGYPEKLIDVLDGVGCGPATSWVDALNIARNFASLRPAQ